MLSKKNAEVFAELLKAEYGKELSLEEASKIANGLVDYFKLLDKIYRRIKDKNN